MPRIGIIGLTPSASNIDVLNRLVQLLAELDVSYALYEDIRQSEKITEHNSSYLGSFKDDIEFSEFNFDFAITLGGDGTMLRAVTLVGRSGVPVLGVNLGRLGFLASLDKDSMENAIKSLIKGRYKIEERAMLFLESNQPLFGRSSFALNDFTLHKRDTSSMVAIDTFINGDFLNTYWADGIIIATPTGSTGYSLSCGGPIIFPGSGNFVVTPVAPHNLNVRPIVISDNSVISFEIRGRTKSFLCSLDSRYAKIDDTFQLAVRKFEYKTKLVHMPEYSYLVNMRQKLAWGVDKRN